MIWRITAMTAFGVMLGAWAYLDVIGPYEELGSRFAEQHEPFAPLTLIAFSVLAGIIVGRGWVLLALGGPIAALAYLQQAGYTVGDGSSALSSWPSIIMLLWLGVWLVIGVGIHHFWCERREQRRAEQP